MLSLQTHEYIACFVITLLYFLEMVIWLALGVMSFSFTVLYCALWLPIQCDWLALLWQAMLQSSLAHVWEGLVMRLVSNWPWEIIIHLVLKSICHWVLGMLTTKNVTTTRSLWWKIFCRYLRSMVSSSATLPPTTAWPPNKCSVHTSCAKMNPFLMGTQKTNL